jgi:hypothetical protein
MPCEIGCSGISDIMNNDAKDVIGRLRAINVLLLLRKRSPPPSGCPVPD